MKRYTTEKQILDAIDAAKQRATDLMKESEQCRDTAKGFAKAGMQEDAKYAFDDARRLAKSSENIMDKKLKKLGMKLAQFRTTPAPFINGAKGVGDASVSQNLSDL